MIKGSKLLNLEFLHLLDARPDKFFRVLKLAEFEEINCRAYESVVHVWLDLRSSLEPFERRAILVAALIAHSEIEHGDVVPFI